MDWLAAGCNRKRANIHFSLFTVFSAGLFTTDERMQLMQESQVNREIRKYGNAGGAVLLRGRGFQGSGAVTPSHTLPVKDLSMGQPVTTAGTARHRAVTNCPLICTDFGIF
jgi:hypothetical protein